MLVKNIAGEKDHIGVQFPDAAVQLRDALAVHGTFAGVQVADLQHPQFAARQGLGGLQAVGGGNQAHSLEIAPEHHGGRSHPGQQAAQCAPEQRLAPNIKNQRKAQGAQDSSHQLQYIRSHFPPSL